MTGLLDRALATIREPLAGLESKVRTTASVHSATITSVDPIRFQLDGEDAPKSITPDTLVGVAAGDRVRMLQYSRTSYLVTGKVGGTGALLLDSGILPDSYEATLTIPRHLQGMFSHYEIILQAGATDTDSNSLRPVSVRINGDDGNNYRSQARVDEVAGGVRASYTSDDTAFPRTAYIGQFSGAARITLIPSSPGNANYTSWTASGWVNNGSGGGNNLLFTTGGRYQGSTGVLRSVVLRTNTTSAHFTDTPRARLWGYR